MERRDWALEALNSLIYINSLDDELRAERLIPWSEKYLQEDMSKFDLEVSDLKKLSELFFTNILFLKKFKNETRDKLDEIKKMKKYLEH